MPVGGGAASPLTILFYNQFFDHWPTIPERCPTECRFTTDPAAFDDADAVVFHLPRLAPIDHLRKRPGQLWVAWSQESRVMCPALDDAAFPARFDVSMTYERSSDVWVPYFGPHVASDFLRPVPSHGASAPVVYLQGNHRDRCGRLAYSGRVMTRVRVDSFGAVHRNQAAVIPPGEAARLALYRRYKMTLAFENSCAPDYVTEKLWEPLRAGSLPIYRGCAEVAELAPAPDCYVDARDFSSPTELGSYLNHLHQDDDEYLRYHEWRSRPLPEAFTRHLEQLRQAPLCRLAGIVARRCRRPADAPSPSGQP